MDRMRRLGVIEHYPRLAAWRDALLRNPAITASTVPEIEQAWQEGMIVNKRWLARFVPDSVREAVTAG
jgi:hypothetical protein